MKEALRDKLRELYAGLDERLPHVAGNPCGTCRICCTADGIHFQHVQEVEFDLIAAEYGAERARVFRAYTERRRDDSGAYLHPLCPNYDEAAGGCGIYSHRPYSCRLFGHFRMQGTALPEPCVFRGHEVEVARGRYLQDVPQAEELRELQRRYSAFGARKLSMVMQGAAHIDEATLRAVRANANPDDPMDMAVLAHLEGQLEESLRLLDQAVGLRPQVAQVHFYRGTVLDAMERPAEAALSYERAVELEADNPQTWMHLAMARLSSGQTAAARQAFERTVALDAEAGVAHGFLGYLLLSSGDAVHALGHLQRAVEADPANPYFQLRLGEALIASGDKNAARPHLQAALSHPSTAAAARQLLG